MKKHLLLLVAFAFVSYHAQGAKPLKVYILSGQSNMQGHADVSTFDHVGMDPKTAPLLKAMRKADGSVQVCERVWISQIGSTEAETHGKLTVGYGAKSTKIGPEFTFGITMQGLSKEPILIIKTAWGGKSIHTDFRPPSAGPYPFNEGQLANAKKQGKDVGQMKADRAKATGVYYRLMMEHVKLVLKDIKRVYPDYDKKAGYELAGFVWFQGWNDMVARDVYPTRDQSGGYAAYSEVLAHFIRDVRKDLDAPKLPFVIGVMGTGGPTDDYAPSQKRYKPVHDNFRLAMAAPAAMPEFKGTVTAVYTETYWDAQLGELRQRGGRVRGKSNELNKDQSLSPKQRKQALDTFKAELYTDKEREVLKGASNAEYHYMGSAKILGQIGKAFAEAVHALGE